MDGDLFETWFRIADEDRDNAIAGAEAVKFFQRSNLSQETLFKVLNLSITINLISDLVDLPAKGAM
jgi:epidermal growth factor receptor substrate 15